MTRSGLVVAIGVRVTVAFVVFEELRELFFVVFGLSPRIRPLAALLGFVLQVVFGNKNVTGLRLLLLFHLFAIVIPTLAVAAAVVVVRLVGRIVGAPGAIVAPVSVEIYLAGLVIVPIGACLKVVVGMALAGLHVVGAVAIVAAFLEIWLTVAAITAVIIMVSVCTMPLQRGVSVTKAVLCSGVSFLCNPEEAPFFIRRVRS